MYFSRISALAGVFGFALQAATHGTVTGIVADGVYYEGYHASFQYLQTQPAVVGWSIPQDLSNGFIAPDAYTNPDIICHLNATNAQTSATVAAGGSVELQWTAWPSSHHGPVIDYLAKCGGDCKTTDKTTLEFFKIDGVGLIDDNTVPGNWATDQLIANNNSWTVKIPSDIAPGNYVLRHEIIALHSAGTIDGAQNYPQCVNLEITGSGTATPSGVLGTALYKETDPGIEINIYQSLSTYIIPGPTLYSGAISASQTNVVSATATAMNSTRAATSIAGSSSAVITGAASSAVSPTTESITAVISPSSSFGHYPNITATSSKKSACKTKSKISSLAVHTQSSSTTSAAFTAFTASVIFPPVSPSVVAVTSDATVSAKVVETGTTVVSAVTAITSSAPTAPEAVGGVTEPEGTTLSDLLKWISDFYNKYAGTSYSGSTVARRHSRALRI